MENDTPRAIEHLKELDDSETHSTDSSSTSALKPPLSGPHLLRRQQLRQLFQIGKVFTQILGTAEIP